MNHTGNPGSETPSESQTGGQRRHGPHQQKLQTETPPIAACRLSMCGRECLGRQRRTRHRAWVVWGTPGVAAGNLLAPDNCALTVRVFLFDSDKVQSILQP
eukprot:1347144-Amorphochlora_amoeboformis.AAC.1